MSSDEDGTGVVSSITAMALVLPLHRFTGLVEGVQASLAFTYLNEREVLCLLQAYSL